MVPFLFRTQRIEHDLAMRVGLQSIRSGRSLPGQLPATVINFSPEGACLIMPKLTLNGKHLFYATLNSDRYNLLLYSEGREDVEKEYKMAARSVWMDVCEHRGKPAFKIGIHFLHNQKDLFNLLRQSPPLA